MQMTVTRQSSPRYDQRARVAVRLLRQLNKDELAQVVTLMPELHSVAAATPRESTPDYWRRVLREERGGYQPTLDGDFLEGMTYRQYFALPETEQDALWDRVFGTAAWEIEDFEEVDVRDDSPTVAAR